MNQNQLPSEALLKFIEIANLIPFDKELTTFDEEEIKKDFPLLAKYLSSFTPTMYEPIPYVSKLLDFIRTRDFMKVLVEISERYEIHLNSQSQIEITEGFTDKDVKEWMKFTKFRITSKPKYNLMKVSTLGTEELGERLFDVSIQFIELTTDDEHQIRIKTNGLLKEIEGCDLRRFKKCVVCQKFIYAYRLNTKFCSKRCSNYYFQKEYLSDEKKREAWNERRKENREHKRKMKKLKEEKKNGTL
jgi:predicted nucleic acid-binding Zn ribbon protein